MLRAIIQQDILQLIQLVERTDNTLIIEWVSSKGSLGTTIIAILRVITEVRTEHDVGHRVGRPLQTHLGIPVVRTGIVLCKTVTILRVGGTKHGHAGYLREGIAIAVVPAHATIQHQSARLLVIQVHTCHLIGCQTLAPATPATTTATARESHVVGVVGIGHQEHLEVVLHHAPEDTSRITVLGTGSQVGIHHDTLVHALLDTKVEHGLFFAILDT